MSLFCGNISHNATARDVESLFMKFGQCRVDVKRGFAFIDFDDDRDAEDAMKDLQGQDLNGMRINVEWSKRHLARRGMPGGRRHDHGREKEDRYRGSYGGGYSDRGHERDRGGRYERDRRDYDDRGGRDRYERREDRYDRDREDRYRDRERDRDGDRYRERSRERGDRERDQDRSNHRMESKERDGSPRGSGWKRSLDEEGDAEQGDQSRRRTEDGYAKEKEGANGNGVGSAAESRDYRDEEKDRSARKSSEDKHDERKSGSPYDDRRYGEERRGDEQYDQERRRSDEHVEVERVVSPAAAKENGDVGNGDIES